MTKLATTLLGTTPNGVTNLVLGMTLEDAVLAHGRNVDRVDGGSVVFKTYKCAGAELWVNADFDDGKLVALESFVQYDDDDKSKTPIMKALKKELTAELTKAHGTPTKQGTTPYWAVTGAVIYLLGWRSRGSADYGVPAREALKLGLRAPDS